jgi:hypothetical protein
LKVFGTTILIAILLSLKIAILNINCLTYFNSTEELDSLVFVPKKQEIPHKQNSTHSISLLKRSNTNFRRQFNNFAIVSSIENTLQNYNNFEPFKSYNIKSLKNNLFKSHLSIRAGPLS